MPYTNFGKRSCTIRYLEKTKNLLIWMSVILSVNGCLSDYFFSPSERINIDLHTVPFTGNYYGGSKKIIFEGDYGFFLNDFGPLKIVDVSDTSNLQLLSEFALSPHRIEDFVIDKDRAYLVGSRFGIITLDISDPANPEALNSYDLKSGEAFTVLKVRNYLYVYAPYSNCKNISPHTFIFDVSDSDRIVLKNKIRGIGKPFESIGDHYFAILPCTEFTSDSTLQIVSIKNPREPEIISIIENLAPVWDMQNFEGYLYVVNTGKTYIVEISEADSARIMNQFEFSGSSLAVNSEYIITGHLNSLIVYNQSDGTIAHQQRLSDMVEGCRSIVQNHNSVSEDYVSQNLCSNLAVAEIRNLHAERDLILIGTDKGLFVSQITHK